MLASEVVLLISRDIFDQDREPTWKPAKADEASSVDIVI